MYATMPSPGGQTLALSDGNADTSDGTVFVVDDESEVRSLLQSVLRDAGFPVQTFDSSAEFLLHHDPVTPGCLLLDVNAPRQSVSDLLQELVRHDVRIPIVFMSAEADMRTAVEAMKSGAVEFLEKPLNEEVLVESLTRALAIDLEWRSEWDEIEEMEGRLNSLTENERVTLELVTAGNSNKVIAGRLQITERAVERRRARILQKLGARSLPEALQLTITHRLLTRSRNSPHAGTSTGPFYGARRPEHSS